MEIFALLCAGASLVVALVAFGYSWRAVAVSQDSVPTEMIKAIGALRVEVAQCVGEMQGHNGKLVAWRAEIEGLYGAVEDTLEATERKARSTSARITRLNRAEGNQGAEGGPQDVLQMDRHQLEARARERGLM